MRPAASPFLAIITGASQGFGQCLAVELGRRIERPLSLVLVARGTSGLQETQHLVQQVRWKESTVLCVMLHCLCVCVVLMEPGCGIRAGQRQTRA